MDALTIFQAAVVLSNDWPTGDLDAVFLFGRAEHDDDGIFDLAAKLASNHGKHGAPVVVNGADGKRQGGSVPGESWPGGFVFKDRLKQAGIKNTTLVTPTYNTRDEAASFIEAAEVHKWKAAAFVCQPHQKVRAFLCLLRAMQVSTYWMRLYAVSPDQTNWNKMVYGSQGKRLLARFDHIVEELKRIEINLEDGTLPTLQELCAYILRRGDIK